MSKGITNVALLVILLIIAAFLYWQYRESSQIRTVLTKLTQTPAPEVKLGCIDSDVNEKPNDIFIKGSVSVSDAQGKQVTIPDECSGNKKQVKEMWCYESPTGSGNYVQGSMVYNCKKGCLDGACMK